MQILSELEDVIAKREKSSSYTGRLLEEAFLVERKVNEECYEVIEAAFLGKRSELIDESCDLIYHLLVLLRKYGISLVEIENELRRRRSDVQTT